MRGALCLLSPFVRRKGEQLHSFSRRQQFASRHRNPSRMASTVPIEVNFEQSNTLKSDRFAPKVLKLVSEGQSYREISRRLGLSKNTVLDIVKRDRAP